MSFIEIIFFVGLWFLILGIGLLLMILDKNK